MSYNWVQSVHTFSFKEGNIIIGDTKYILESSYPVDLTDFFRMHKWCQENLHHKSWGIFDTLLSFCFKNKADVALFLLHFP